MNPKQPSLKTICLTIQCEEICRKVMTRDINPILPNTCAYLT
jgi:hypothetical protein